MYFPFRSGVLNEGYALQGGLIGRLFDKFGPRWLMIVGSAVYVVAVMVTSISTEYYQYLLAQGVLFGTAAGLLYVCGHFSFVFQASPIFFYFFSFSILAWLKRTAHRFYPSLASVSTYFTKYKATAIGLAAAGSSVGPFSFSVIVPI